MFENAQTGPGPVEWGAISNSLHQGESDAVAPRNLCFRSDGRSLGTASQIKKLANDIGLERLFLVGNKVRNHEEQAFLESESPGLPVLGFLPADLKVQEADRLGIPVYEHVATLKKSASSISESLSVYIKETNVSK